jgi:hypothetical protein
MSAKIVGMTRGWRRVSSHLERRLITFLVIVSVQPYITAYVNFFAGRNVVDRAISAGHEAADRQLYTAQVLLANILRDNEL